jgi:hypothetical protein
MIKKSTLLVFLLLLFFGIVSCDEKVIDSDGDRFKMYASGVVLDVRTNLEWYVGPDESTSWDEAKSWVENLSVSGGGWRMPTREDLRSLYRRGKGTNNMTPLLETTGSYVWTGETHSPNTAVDFYFDVGRDRDSVGRGFSMYHRAFAVRSRR